MSAFTLASPAFINFHGIARAMGKTREVSKGPIIRGDHSEALKKMLAETNKWIQENKFGFRVNGGSCSCHRPVAICDKS